VLTALDRPIGTAAFIVPSDGCRGEFCGVAMNVDLEIEPRAPRD
jgi:hypothetical protein